MRATGGDPRPAGHGAQARSDLFTGSTTSVTGQHASQQQQHQQQQVPQPKRSQDVDELIHFVRNYQGLQRETTDLRLKRHALLPGIGQTAPATTLGDGDRLGDVQEEGRGGGDNRSNDGYNSDSDLDAELPSGQERRRTPSPPPLWRSDPNPLSSASTSSTTHSRYAPPPSEYDKRTGHRLNPQGHRLKLNPTGVSHGGGRAGRRITADVHQLPPIQWQDLPERPEGPVPGGGDKGVDRGGDTGRERPKSAGLRRRRRASVGDSFTDRLGDQSEDEDGNPIDYIE